MVAGLHGGGGDVTEEEEEPGKPQDAMDEGRDAFVEPNAPLHPSLVDVAADVAMQVPAQKCDHRLSLPDWCNGFAAMALVPRRRASRPGPGFRPRRRGRLVCESTRWHPPRCLRAK